MADEQKQEEKKQEEVKQEASKKPEEAKPAAAPAPAPEAPVEEAKPEEAKPAKAAPTGKLKDLIKDIESLSVAELAELVKTLEDRFGVNGAPVAVAAPAPAGTPAEGGTAVGGEAPKKASFTVHLAASGDQKIAVIKALREVRPDLGLKEAKDLVDGAPKDVAANVAAEAAEEAKKKLEAAGAKVELK